MKALFIAAVFVTFSAQADTRLTFNGGYTLVSEDRVCTLPGYETSDTYAGQIVYDNGPVEFGCWGHLRDSKKTSIGWVNTFGGQKIFHLSDVVSID